MLLPDRRLLQAVANAYDLKSAGGSVSALVGVAMTNDRESFHRAPPAPTWPEIQDQLQALRDDVQRMLQDAPGDADLYQRFAGMAAPILERAPPELVESVQSELGTILRDLGLSGDAVD